MSIIVTIDKCHPNIHTTLRSTALGDVTPSAASTRLTTSALLAAFYSLRQEDRMRTEEDRRTEVDRMRPEDYRTGEDRKRGGCE